MRDILFHDNGPINKDVVGQSAIKIAAMAGIKVPETTRVIVVEAHGVGAEDSICREKCVLYFVLFPTITLKKLWKLHAKT